MNTEEWNQCSFVVFLLMKKANNIPMRLKTQEKSGALPWELETPVNNATSPQQSRLIGAAGLLIHGIEKVPVSLRLLQFLEQEFHALDRTERIQDFSQNPHAV